MGLRKMQIGRDERGLVSIVVTTFVILIMSILILGFSNYVRREQRQSLDRQLSTQAYYAAESGVNKIVQQLESGTPVATVNTCTPETVSADSIITCLLVNTTPTDQIQNVGDSAKVMVIKPANPADQIATLDISWVDSNQSNKAALPGGDCAPSNSFPASASWPCPIGILRLDIVANQPAGSFDRATLTNSMGSIFLVPSTSPGGAVAYHTTANQGAVQKVACSGGGGGSPEQATCRVSLSIASIPISAIAEGYSLRLRKIYGNDIVVSVAPKTSTGAAVALKDGQIVVDSTGKIADVLRRIQVRLPAQGGDYDAPSFAADITDGICKQYSYIPGVSVTDNGGCGF